MEIIFMVLPEKIILQGNCASFDAEKKGRFWVQSPLGAWQVLWAQPCCYESPGDLWVKNKIAVFNIGWVKLPPQ